MQSIKKQLQHYINDKIRITNAMGLKVISFSSDSLSMSLPLHPNTNDKCTAFAGSIYSSLVLSGWAYLKGLCLEMETAHEILIAESSTKYSFPVSDDSQACARLATSGSYGDLIRRLPNERKLRIPVHCTIENYKGTAVSFDGIYYLRKPVII